MMRCNWVKRVLFLADRDRAGEADNARLQDALALGISRERDGESRADRGRESAGFHLSDHAAPD